MCIVLSTHILEEVRILCDRVAIVSAGRVVAQGPPKSCAATPDANRSKTLSYN